MIRVFKPEEIPVGYKQAIINDGYNLNDIKYVLQSDDKDTWRVAEKLGYYQLVPTITEEWLYVLIKE